MTDSYVWGYLDSAAARLMPACCLLTYSADHEEYPREELLVVDSNV
jgi:hypothetical protein